ncbi:hypothetical protein D9B68_04950 [Serratia marcescens]|nr:hypothetical protein D9B68_04950 [Serratia marcescens]RTG56095.1 hypothetical protein D9B61_03365 [Serratia marcescens]
MCKQKEKIKKGVVQKTRIPIMRLHRHGTCEQLHRVSGGRREKILKIRVDSERGKRNIRHLELASESA